MRIILVIGVIAIISFFQVYRVNSEYLAKLQNSPARVENPKDGEIPETEAESQPGVDFCKLDSVQCESDKTENATIEEKIKNIFRDDYKTALAVAKAESRLRPDAQGFNCHYNGVSRSCRKGDEHKAWSTDCGLFQINVPGTACPQYLFDPARNIQVAFEKYQKRGWQPWSAWKSGAYIKFLN